MAARSVSLLMLKMDRLTVKFCYEDGRLVDASTRGDGETGEMVTHNIPAFYNVSVSIPIRADWWSPGRASSIWMTLRG